MEIENLRGIGRLSLIGVAGVISVWIMAVYFAVREWWGKRKA